MTKQPPDLGDDPDGDNTAALHPGRVTPDPWPDGVLTVVTAWAMDNAEVPQTFEARLMLPDSVLDDDNLMAELGTFLQRDAEAQGARVRYWHYRVVDPADYAAVPSPAGWSLVEFELAAIEADPITSAIEPAGAQAFAEEAEADADELPPLADGAVFEEVPGDVLHEPNGNVWCFCAGPGGRKAHRQGVPACTSVLTDG